MRVYQLAKELGTTSANVIAELRRRGEFVKSAQSDLPPPVVRKVRDIFPALEPMAEQGEVIDPALYGRSADVAERTDTETEESFASALARISRRPRAVGAGEGRAQSSWSGDPLSPIVQALLDFAIVPERHPLSDLPDGQYFPGEVKRAKAMSLEWVAARLDGLDCSDAVVVSWIQATGGRRADVAANLVKHGITLGDALQPLWYDRIQPGRSTILQRLLAGSLTPSAAVDAIRRWRKTVGATG